MLNNVSLAKTTLAVSHLLKGAPPASSTLLAKGRLPQATNSEMTGWSRHPFRLHQQHSALAISGNKHRRTWFLQEGNTILLVCHTDLLRDVKGNWTFSLTLTDTKTVPSQKKLFPTVCRQAFRPWQSNLISQGLLLQARFCKVREQSREGHVSLRSLKFQ